MNLDRYPILSDSDHATYEFLSEGPKGTIKKVVMYQQVQPGIFNLAFGDWDEINQTIDDKTRSNNNDRDKILATIASTALDFMIHHPEAIILAQGITPGKTRLYQMGINQNWRDIGLLVDIKGFCDGGWEPLKPGRNYEAFIVEAR